MAWRGILRYRAVRPSLSHGTVKWLRALGGTGTIGHVSRPVRPVRVLLMLSNGSVTGWLGQMRQGEPDAVQRLWERYFVRLVGLARQRLRDAPRRAADEEDVALSAFDSFCRGAEAGRFPLLEDRDSLWRLLVVL